MNTQKGFATVLGLLLILAVVGGGAYIYTQSDINIFNVKKVNIEDTLIATSTNTEKTVEPKKSAVKTEVKASLSTEDSPTESFKEQPVGFIYSIKNIGGEEYSLEVDLVSYNPSWKHYLTDPNNKEPRYINQSKEIRTLTLNKHTRFYACGDPFYPYPEKYDLSFYVKTIMVLLEKTDESELPLGPLGDLFDISGTMVTAVHQDPEECAG